MKFKGRDSGAWHKNINDTAGLRRPADPDFPWIALQNHTGYYIKRKGRMSSVQVEERLLALIQNHPSKEIAIAACASRISSRTMKDLLIKDFITDPSGALEGQETLQIIIATNHENPGAVSEIEAQWANCLLEHAAPSGSSSISAQQLYNVLSLLRTRMSPDLLLHENIKRLADSVCARFANSLHEFRCRSQWLDAHRAVGWLSTDPISSKTSSMMSVNTTNLLDDHLPGWGAWAAWRPDIPRLRTWMQLTNGVQFSLKDLLALEGPDFVSMTGSEQATLQKGLIAQGSRLSQSMLQWGTTHVSFTKNPFKRSETLSAILERLTIVIDSAGSAGPEYTALLALLSTSRIICDEVLQILENVRVFGDPALTTVILQTCAVPELSAGRKLTDTRQLLLSVGQEVWDIRQLLPALSDPRILALRRQILPYIKEKISTYVRELQGTLLAHFREGNEWVDATRELLDFTLWVQDKMQDKMWLLVELERSVQQSIISAPSLVTIETLIAIRSSIRGTSSLTPSPLQSEIDAYCKAQLLPGYANYPESKEVVEVLISLWNQTPDRNRRELALLIGDLSNTSCEFRCDCLRDLSTLSKSWGMSLLHALNFRDGNPDSGCIALIGLLALEKRTEILRRWRKVLSFAIEKQHEKLLLHAVTNLNPNIWFELLSNIRLVYKGSGVITERHVLRLLSLELHSWSQQSAAYLPAIEHLKSVIKHGPAMRLLLLGPDASENRQLLQALDYVQDSKSSDHTKFMDYCMARLRIGNVGEIEAILSAVSKASSKGAEACLRVLNSRGQKHAEMAEVDLAISLQTMGSAEPDCLALRKTAKFIGIELDAEGFPLAIRLKKAAGSVHKRYLELMNEARRLENLRLSLQAAAPANVLDLLARLNIETPRVADDALASLPSSLASLVEKVSNDEIELQFPATKMTRLQRFAIGASDAESFLIRLTLGPNGAPIKFCVHLSAEFSNRINSRDSSSGNCHTPWEVFRGSSRPPHEQYCGGRPNIGAYQVSRMLWHHLHHNFRSLEQSHKYMTSKLAVFGQGCAVCGRGHRRLRRATICPSDNCKKTFQKAPIEIQLAELWQDPPVVDLLLSMIHATASTGNLSLLIDCPANDATAVVGMLDGLPAIPVVAKHLKVCLNVHGNGFCLAQALAGYCTQYSTSQALAKGLVWALLSYRGFLVSATVLQRVPSFGRNQFLLANAAPDLEIAFSRHLSTPSPISQVVFHGTSLDRLHAILCQGLRVLSGSPLMRNAAVFGPGIYVADEPRVAWDYATTTTGGWKSSSLKDKRLLLGCELAGPKPKAARAGVYVITDATRLIVRYVFLLESAAGAAAMPAAKDVRIPMESMFKSLRSDTL